MNKFFEEVLDEFENWLKESLPKIISVTLRYTSGEYQISLFISLCYLPDQNW